LKAGAGPGFQKGGGLGVRLPTGVTAEAGKWPCPGRDRGEDSLLFGTQGLPLGAGHAGHREVFFFFFLPFDNRLGTRCHGGGVGRLRGVKRDKRRVAGAGLKRFLKRGWGTELGREQGLRPKKTLTGTPQGGQSSPRPNRKTKKRQTSGFELTLGLPAAGSVGGERRGDGRGPGWSRLRAAFPDRGGAGPRVLGGGGRPGRRRAGLRDIRIVGWLFPRLGKRSTATDDRVLAWI